MQHMIKDGADLQSALQLKGGRLAGEVEPERHVRRRIQPRNEPLHNGSLASPRVADQQARATAQHNRNAYICLPFLFV